jgi:hypothetical protein
MCARGLDGKGGAGLWAIAEGIKEAAPTSPRLMGCAELRNAL